MSNILAVYAGFLVCFIYLGAFEAEEVSHVEGDVNPIRDLEIIFDELRMKDLQFLTGVIEKLEKTVQKADKAKKQEYVRRKQILLSFIRRKRRKFFNL